MSDLGWEFVRLDRFNARLYFLFRNNFIDELALGNTIFIPFDYLCSV